MTASCRSRKAFALAAVVLLPILFLMLFSVLFLITGCKRPPLPPHPSDQTPKIRATVITIRTIVQPANQTLTHTIVIAEGRARSSNDLDAWRLLDFAGKQVTYVDEIRKTSRVEPFAAVLARRRQELARPLPAGSPTARFAPSGARRTLLGVAASEWVLRVGGYERHLWIARHPSIPDDLFAMLQASGASSSQMTGLTRTADEAFLQTSGFPLVDHSELPFGNAKLVVDKTVIGIEQRDVPQSWFRVPAADRVAAIPTPAVSRPTVPARRQVP